MGKSIQAKRFFMSAGINITTKTNNGSNFLWSNHLPHHYIPPPNFTVFLTHWEDKRSPFLRLIDILPSDPNKLKLDSSLKWTIFHCSSAHRTCPGAKSRRTFWFFFEIKVLQHGIQAANFSLFNLKNRFFFRLAFLFAHKMHEKSTLLNWNSRLKTF